MKKLIIIFVFLIIFQNTNSIIYLSADTKFARIETTTQIYKSTSNSDKLENIYCLAEESYFVEIIGDYEDYFRINYNGINGYVKKIDVKEITNTPYTPYPKNIKIIIENTCNLRSSPTTKADTNNIISVIKSNETELTFIGRTLGEEAIDFGGSTWYYVNYQGNHGYVYNKYVKSITPIYQNNEEFTYKKPSINKIENPITHTPSLLIIILLLIPFIGMLVILYLPSKFNVTKKTKKTPKIIDKY